MLSLIFMFRPFSFSWDCLMILLMLCFAIGTEAAPRKKNVAASS